MELVLKQFHHPLFANNSSPNVSRTKTVRYNFEICPQRVVLSKLHNYNDFNIEDADEVEFLDLNVIRNLKSCSHVDIVCKQVSLW